MTGFRDISPVEKSIAIWQVEDGLLQQYRAISLSVQSFIIVVAALIAENFSKYPDLQRVFVFIFALGLFHIFFIWHPIVRYRGRIVNYHKQIIFGDYSAEQIEDINRIAKAELYANNFYARLDLSCKYAGFKDENGVTRLKMDFYVPAIYIFIWICLLYFVLRSNAPGTA